MADWLTKQQRSFNMSSIRSRGTKPELLLGVLLRDMFPRRKIVSHPESLIGKPDYLLPGLKLVTFADGCFWHGCPRHGREPEDNSDYWGPKLERNRKRDRTVARQLRASGFVVVRIWDHELRGSMAAARAKIRRALKTAGSIAA
ncbi:MAG: very short patch repair endonuclease [Acidimicrobiia bacterium]